MGFDGIGGEEFLVLTSKNNIPSLINPTPIPRKV